MTADTNYPELAGIVAGVAVAGHLVCRRFRRRGDASERAVVLRAIRDTYRDEGRACGFDGPDEAA